MKKLLYSALAIAMLGGSYQANSQVWSENFNSGIPSSWVKINVDGLTPNSAFNAAIVSGLTANAWMAWQRATGDSAALTTSWFTSAAVADRWLITPSFQVTNTNMVLSWEDFTADPSFPDNMEVLVSATAGTTTSAFTTSLYNASGATGDYERHGINLGAYNGQTIRIAFRNHSNDKYLLFMDNANTAVLPAVDGAVDSVDFPKLASAGTAVKALVENTGATTLTSVDLNYTIDAGSPVSQTFSVNLAPYAKTWVTFTTTVSASSGPHTVTVNLTKSNGSTDPITTNNTKSTSFTIATSSTTRTGIIEEFSSSTCAPCASFNATFDPLIISATNNANSGSSRFSVIKYQMNWPSPGNDVSYNPDGLTRRNYYAVSGIPDHFTNGAQGGAGDQAEIDASKTTPAYMTMTGSYVVKGDSLIATVIINPTFTLNNAGFKLHVATVEDHYQNPGNTTGQLEYYHVMRKMLPDGNGTTINTFVAGTQQTFTFRYKYTVGTVTQNSFLFWNHPMAGSMVAFVQDNSNGDIIQALTVRASWPAAVANVTSGIGNLSIYPNPANEHTSVAFSLEKTSEVSVSIVDNLGREVYNLPTQQINAGNVILPINTTNLASGLYNLTIRTENGMVTERLNVVK